MIESVLTVCVCVCVQMAGASVKKATESLVNAAQQATAKQAEEDAANIASGGGPQVRLWALYVCSS